MLTDFDQNTIANMTAALEYVCRQIPKDKDGREIRKRVTDAMVQCGRKGKRALIDFQNAGMTVLNDINRPLKWNWFGLTPVKPSRHLLPILRADRTS